MSMEDKELKEMQGMELAFKKACELHFQYEHIVTMKRLEFQRNCPHTELRTSDYGDPIQRKRYNIFHCKRCGKLIKKEEK